MLWYNTSAKQLTIEVDVIVHLQLYVIKALATVLSQIQGFIYICYVHHVFEIKLVRPKCLTYRVLSLYLQCYYNYVTEGLQYCFYRLGSFSQKTT